MALFALACQQALDTERRPEQKITIFDVSLLQVIYFIYKLYSQCAAAFDILKKAHLVCILAVLTGWLVWLVTCINDGS